MAVSLLVESWVWYSLCVFIVAARLLSRGLLFRSVKKLKVDDWMMLGTLVPYTALLVTINIVSHTSSNLIVPGENVNDFSKQEIADRVYGSKLVVVVEQMQCITVWLLKGCFIFLYYRLTINLSANKAVKVLGVYMGVTFVVMEILYLGVWCRPFNNYFTVPTSNIQCSAATNHLITNAVFNLSSDIIMLGIGLSLFVRSTLPLNRKLILCAIFSLGIFVILASVLNKYYSFTHPFGSQWTFWYVRESSTGILVANMPFLWTLLRRIFKLDAFGKDPGASTVPYHSSRTARGRHTRSPRDSKNINRHGGTRSGKHGSNNSSVDMEQVSPTMTKAPELPKPPPRASWKDQGVFGRDDIGALALDSWDFGNDLDLPLEGVDEYSRPATRQGSILSRPDSTTSNPGSHRRSRRIRDEEAQYALQEDVGSNCHYYEGPKDYLSSVSSLGEVKSNDDVMSLGEEQNDLDFITTPNRQPSPIQEARSSGEGQTMVDFLTTPHSHSSPVHETGEERAPKLSGEGQPALDFITVPQAHPSPGHDV